MLAAVIQRHPDRVDAVARPLIIAERHVGGRKAELTPALCRRAEPPSIAKVRVSSRVAVPESPAPAALRGCGWTNALAVEHDRRDRSALIPSLRQQPRSTSTLPSRPLPKVKSSPVTTPTAPSARQAESATKSSARSRRARRRNRTPASRRPRPRRTAPGAGRAWSAGTAAGRLEKATGCGSKVATITGRRSWNPRATARPTTAWWPR